VTLLYTSGTTRNPKGVVNTHHGVLFESGSHRLAGTVPKALRSVSYLPLAHIAERVLTIYLPIHEAAHIYFCPDQKDLLGTLQQVQPTSFFGVPRVWQTIQAGILAMLAAEQDETKKAAVARAMDAGRAYVEGCQRPQVRSPRTRRTRSSSVRSVGHCQAWNSRSPKMGRSWPAAPSTLPATLGRPRRQPRCSARMAGCTPATSAHSTRITSSAWSTARRNSSSRPGDRTCPRPPSRACSWSTRWSGRRSPSATGSPMWWLCSPSTVRSRPPGRGHVASRRAHWPNSPRTQW